jgi:hypothetical protein
MVAGCVSDDSSQAEQREDQGMSIRIDARDIQPPPPKPVALPVKFDQVPQELRERPQWVLWRYTWKEKEQKWDKPPFSIHGGMASTTDPQTWGSFDEVRAAYEQGDFDGIGIVLTADDPILGIDLDNCRDESTGAIQPWSSNLRAKFAASAPDPLVILSKLQSYCEVSPSGRGFRILCHGVLPGKRNKIGGKGSDCPDGIEFYKTARYLTITGNRMPASQAGLAECNGSLTDVYRAIFGQDKPDQQEQPPQAKSHNAAKNAGHVPTDDEILDKAENAANREKFKRLMEGNIEGYASESEADSGLAFILAFWTRDKEQIGRIMRTSKLVRDKWDRDDYLPGTIDKALENVTEFYSWTPTEPLNAIYYGEDENGKAIFAPRPMVEVMQQIAEVTGGWPRRVGTALFVHDGTFGVSWLDNRAALFGYVASKTGNFSWRAGDRYVTQEQVYHEFRRTSQLHTGIENMPHWPAIIGRYYTCQTPPAGNGAALAKFLDFFCLETPLDRQILLANVATLAWGGPSGARPAIMVTARTGRGRGKTKLSEMISRPFGGTIDISANEDAGIVKQRLLSPEAASKRVALLDNVKSPRFSWAELEALITCDSISGKRLYVGEASKPNDLTWIITLNGASLSTDMAQRVIELRLGEPPYDGGWDEHVRAYIDQNLQAILADIGGFFQRPKKPLRRRTRWATWETEVLARVDEPDACLDLITQRRGAVDVEEEEGQVIEDYFAHRLAALGYDTDRDDVFIPNNLAADWYNHATGDKYKVTAVTRSLKQLHNESRIRRIIQTVHCKYGRGFRWVGDHVLATTPTQFNIWDKINAGSTLV